MTLNISILEDNGVYLKYLGHMLEQMDIVNYKLFDDPQDFLNVSNSSLHIAVIDHYLGDMTGLEVVQRLLRKSQDCFVIVISAEGSESIVASYMNASCDRYIRKGDPEFVPLFRKFVREGVEKMTRFLSLKHGNH